MPIQISEKGPVTISVVLGYGDIGIGNINHEDHKGLGFVQLKDTFKRGEVIPEDQQQGEDTIKVCLILNNKRGLAELRRSVAMIENEMGVSSTTLADKISNGFMEEIGDKESEIERLTYELKQARARISELENGYGKET